MNLQISAECRTSEAQKHKQAIETSALQSQFNSDFRQLDCTAALCKPAECRLLTAILTTEYYLQQLHFKRSNC